jgi:tetratricopeptide (TPR) repeat protein
MMTARHFAAGVAIALCVVLIGTDLSPASAQTTAAEKPSKTPPTATPSAPPAIPPTPADQRASKQQLPNPVVSPFIERYMMDELKALRKELADTRVQLVREVTDRQLRVAETVSNVANNTVTFFFYVFAGLGTAFAFWGWTSIRDLKSTVKVAAEAEIIRLSQEYETRLTALEVDLKSKSKIILENQREFEVAQTVRALWLQSNQAPNPRTKIEYYDQILELAPGDPETMAYKADAALQLGERDWALSLCNRILEENPDSSLALYQRACSWAGLGEFDAAIVDLEKAIELAPGLRDQARTEEEFASLTEHEAFKALIEQSESDSS